MTIAYFQSLRFVDIITKFNNSQYIVLLGYLAITYFFVAFYKKMFKKNAYQGYYFFLIYVKLCAMLYKQVLPAW